MKDKYKELSETLSTIMNLIDEFDDSKNDYKKPDIRANQVKLMNLGKIIGNTTLKHITQLNSDIDLYLSDPIKENFSKVSTNAIVLKNDLWEL